MKQGTKQIIALLLAIASVVTFAMPTVFATGTGMVPESAESVVYQFYMTAFKDKKLATVTAEIKEGYEAGIYDWRYEAAASGYQFRQNGVDGASGTGGNCFHNANTESVVYYGGGSQWFAVRIQSPGAGEYDLTLTHGATNKGGSSAKVFFVKASEIDNALGENAADYATAMSENPYQSNGTTELFTTYKAAVEAAFADKTAVMTPNFYAASATKDLTATGMFTFEADAEYVMIVQSNGYSYLESLQATRVPEEEPSTEASSPAGEPAVSKHYQIYLNEFKNQKLANVLSDIKTGYEAGTYDWRYEAAASGYQFRLNGVDGASSNGGNAFHDDQTESVVYYGGGSQWFAIRIQSPGAGEYDLTLTYGQGPKGGSNTKVYLVKASQIDGVLGANAQSYATEMSANPYQQNGESEIFKAYKAAVEAAFNGKTAVMTPDFYAAAYAKDVTATGRFTFEANTEYVMIVQTNGYSYLSALDAEPVTEDSTEPTDSTEPSVEATEPVNPDGSRDYKLFITRYANQKMAYVLSDIKAGYESGIYSWRYEAASTGYQFRLDGVDGASGTGGNSFHNNSTESLVYYGGPNQWFAVRIKSPGEGKYKLTLTHGAGTKGATAASVVFIKASEIDAILGENAAAYATEMSANPYQKNGESEIFKAYKAAIEEAMKDQKSAIKKINCYSEAGYEKDRTTVGSFTFEADCEYIMVFKDMNGYVFAESLNVIPSDGSEDEEQEDDGLDIPAYTQGVYQFYMRQFAGTYLYHYRTEEELGTEIVSDTIEKLYKEGKLNWCYELSNGYSQFASGGNYISATVGEGNYLVFKIKAPGTGTYELTYNHMAIGHEKSGTYGDVIVVPAVEGKDYTYIKGEAATRTPIIVTNYNSEESKMVSATGTYTAFEEGKEYWICLGVGDDDNSKSSSLRLYPNSISMVRTGEWAPEPGNEPDDGVVYQLFQEEYVQKYLYHSTEASVYDTVANRYANGSLNWRFESIAGNAYYQAKYLQLGTNKNGNAAIFRIKAPGTGTYKVTLKYFENSDGKAANKGSVYILPYEEGLDHTENIDRLACAPIIQNSYQGTKAGTPPAQASGTYGFEAGKEYLVYIYGLDNMDTNNKSASSTYMYVDRLVMKWVGEYVPEEESITLGGVAVESPVSVFRTSDNIIISQVNGHDYMALPAYGGTLMIYDLDEWRLLDEVYTGLDTPRGAVVDQNGNYWITGAGLTMYCYNPYTMTGFSTDKFLVGGSTHAMSCGDDGYLYFGCYASTGATVFRVNPEGTTETSANYQSWATPTWGKYVGEIHQEGDYIYAAVSGDDRHEILIYNKYTGKLLKSLDFTEAMGDTRYLTGLDFLEPGVLALCTPEYPLILNTETWEFMDAESMGITSPILRSVSELKDGKSYFVMQVEGLTEYDAETNIATALGGEFSYSKTRLRSKDTNFVTIDDTRLPNPCLVTYGGMSADGLNLYCYNIEEKRVVTLIGLVEPSYGIGQNLHSITNGLPGSNEIYFGAAYEAPVGVYNTETQEFSRTITTNGQSDSFLVYKDTMYIGEYNLCTLTQLKDGQAISLFRLNDEHKIFDQARIHTITAGDDKVFVGTVPHVYRNGGLIAWYDLETELTYVVTGENPEDVYYTKASQIMPTYTWYSAVTHEEVDFSKEFDQDVDGDGVCEYFLGPIPLQSITKLVYRDGLLFGISAPRGGSGAVDPVGQNAKIFVYDVENMKMLKVIDLRNYIGGLPEKLLYFGTLAADPDIDNKYWFIFSETLMSFTYDKDTNKFNFKVELEFDRTTQWDGGRVTRTRDIIFKDGYMYFCFDKIGGFVKVNKENPKDYVQLLSNFKSIYEIPIVYTLGEDGDLYYITGDTNMYVLNLDVTEEELAEAQAVQDAIDLISDTVTLADRDAIEAARKAWNEMDPANQPYVNNYQKLVDAEVELLKCRVDALGDTITIEQEQELKDIGNDYRALTLEQRMEINYLKVSKAESQMSLLVADRLVQQIAALGEITLEKTEAVRQARAEFMALSRYERTLITNIDVLNAAEAIIMKLTLQRSEADAVIKKIEDIGFVFFNFGAVSDARKAYNKLEDAAKALVDNYGTLVAAEVLIVTECVIAAAVVAGGITICAVPKFRSKIFKKKAKAE